jgi:hypothetical protein
MTEKRNVRSYRKYFLLSLLLVLPMVSLVQIADSGCSMDGDAISSKTKVLDVTDF